MVTANDDLDQKLAISRVLMARLLNFFQQSGRAPPTPRSLYDFLERFTTREPDAPGPLTELQARPEPPSTSTTTPCWPSAHTPRRAAPAPRPEARLHAHRRGARAPGAPRAGRLPAPH